jgi:hypothetical protein
MDGTDSAAHRMEALVSVVLNFQFFFVWLFNDAISIETMLLRGLSTNMEQLVK